jgi:hypothetical protein
MLFVLVSGGCSTVKTSGITPEPAKPQEPQHKHQPNIPPPAIHPKDLTAQLKQAKELIQSGKDEAARDLLQKISSEQSQLGVTDEALFHQGVLSFKYENEAGGYPQTRQILERLIHNYPGSIWAAQATPLNELLAEHWQSEVALGKARRQIKSLKDSNISLSRENKEMHLNIEKLKTLEQEMELKSRR